MHKQPSSARNRARSPAFTLIELLVVVAIISLVSVLVTQAVSGISQGLSLTNARNMVLNELNFARQTAMSTNQTVEVRFYQDNHNGNAYDTIVSLIPANADVTGSAEQWLEKPNLLPTGVLFDTNLSFSTLITNTTGNSPGSSPVASPAGTSDPSALPLLQGENYTAFHFEADGRTDLDTTLSASGTQKLWYLTLCLNHSQTQQSGAPAANFVTILIDPVIGRIRAFQPH